MTQSGQHSSLKLLLLFVGVLTNWPELGREKEDDLEERRLRCVVHVMENRLFVSVSVSVQGGCEGLRVEGKGEIYSQCKSAQEALAIAH